MPVILINSFEVPEGEDDEFVKLWSEVTDMLRQEPGYISAKLHKSLDSKARFRFVNVAEWESPQDFQKAINKFTNQDAFSRIAAWSNPSLYTIIKQ